MAAEPASCPLCGRAGQTGEPCPAPTCRRRRYHFVPDRFLQRQDEVIDGLIGQRWDDVVLVRRLGAGGVGAIYLGLQMPLAMMVAVKMLTHGAPPTLAARLKDEAQALARLRHHHIVQLLRYGSIGRHTYIVMEYVEGGRTLADAIEHGELDRDAAARVMRQLIEALEYAHSADVVHRDVKPENVMLQRRPRDPHFVKLVDFGLAKFIDGGRESTQLAAGTPTYMAPEQITRRQIGPWTDWYAVAMIALEVLVGHRPYQNMRTDEVVRAKMGSDCDPTAGLERYGLRPAVTRFFHLALAADPRNRLRSGSVFRGAFDAMVAALPPPLSPTVHGDVAALPALRAAFDEVPDPEELPIDQSIAAGMSALSAVRRSPGHADRPTVPRAESGELAPTSDLDATAEHGVQSEVPSTAPRTKSGPRLIGQLPAGPRPSAARSATIHIDHEQAPPAPEDEPTLPPEAPTHRMQRPLPGLAPPDSTAGAAPASPWRDPPTLVSSAGRPALDARRAPDPPTLVSSPGRPALDARRAPDPPTLVSSPGRRVPVPPPSPGRRVTTPRRPAGPPPPPPAAMQPPSPPARSVDRQTRQDMARVRPRAPASPRAVAMPRPDPPALRPAPPPAREATPRREGTLVVGDAAEPTSPPSRGMKTGLVVALLVTLGVLAAVVWLMINPPQGG